ncbi:hypothetical protein CEXT_313071 [Caerostris extrusa]|uniref:t-SNARE coiled-coil homology domain-containing protein n=1 Tax=Caerostris extrusa TaxID=172846 RepID=A0AAV4MC30_CAEEX|nr:hypothetical protein CEXT_313071 [Caerostris extrusa]
MSHSVLIEKESDIDKQLSFDSTDNNIPTNHLSKIESTVVDTGAVTPKEQGNAINRIDSSVDNIAVNVEPTHSELIRHSAAVERTTKMSGCASGDTSEPGCRNPRLLSAESRSRVGVLQEPREVG